jgi:hypothetical protein
MSWQVAPVGQSALLPAEHDLEQKLAPSDESAWQLLFAPQAGSLGVASGLHDSQKPFSASQARVSGLQKFPLPQSVAAVQPGTDLTHKPVKLSQN